jgi:succinyl-CoA synthetase beta subunit
MKQIVQTLIKRKGPLAENEVKDLLKAYDIPTTRFQLIKKNEQLEKVKVPFPVALKVCSSKILHKTDVDGVKLNIKTREELEKEFAQFRKKFPTENLLIDHMVPSGAEIIVGLVQDSTFGLTIMCGIGGIFTELYKDVSFRVVPIDQYDAKQMIEELKGKQLLEGFRHLKANKEVVVELLLKVSSIGEELMDRIDQMDLNPVFVYEKDLCVVDAKLILK